MTITSSSAAVSDTSAAALDEDATNTILLRAAAACEENVIAELLVATGRGPHAVQSLNAQRQLFDRLATELLSNRRRRAKGQLAAIRRQRIEAA